MGLVGERYYARYEEDGISLLTLKEQYTPGGKACISGWGNVSFVEGFGSVELAGRDANHRLTITADVSSWQFVEGDEASSYITKEDMCQKVTVTPTKDGGTNTIRDVREIPAYSNYEWKRNANGARLTAKDCVVTTISGYRNVSLTRTEVFSVTGGNFEQTETSSNIYVEEQEENDNLEYPFFRFYLPHTQDRVTKSSLLTKSSAKGSISVKDSLISGEVFGFETVTIQSSRLEDAVTGGEYRHEMQSLEDVTSSGYVLYIDEGVSTFTESVRKSSKGTLLVTGDSILLGTVSGYNRVQVIHSTAEDFSWAVEDELLEQKNGTYQTSRNTTHHYNSSDVEETVKYDIQHGGSITVTDSVVENLIGYDTVMLTRSAVTSVSQDMLFSHNATANYGYGGYRPVYAAGPINEDATAVEVEAQVRSVPSFGFFLPNIVSLASGKLTMTDSTVADGISGYKTITAKGGSITGDIVGGKHTERAGKEKDTLLGTISLQDVALHGMVSGFQNVKFTQVSGIESDILAGTQTITANGELCKSLSGTVTLNNSQVSGYVTNAKILNLTSSSICGVYTDITDAGTMNINLRDSVVTDDLSGRVAVTVYGNTQIEGSLYGDVGKDTLTVKGKAKLEIAGDVALFEDKNLITVEKNGLLTLRGFLDVGEEGTVKVNGELLLLGEDIVPFANGTLTGNGVVCMTSETYDESKATMATNFQGRLYDVGTWEVAQAFQGTSAERGDNSPSGAVNLIDWMGEETSRKGWLCGRENMYYIMDDTIMENGLDIYDPRPWPPYDWILPWVNPRYLTDKEDWFTLNLGDALDAGWTTLNFSDNVNVYLTGEHYFDILDRGESLDLGNLCERLGRTTTVEICVTVSGTTFITPGNYTIAII